MESCRKYSEINITEGDLKHIKLSLKKMHLLDLIHFDIKPSNLMFSDTLQKIIFIDFGLSSIIKQKIGQKTLTGFKGTLAYCGS